MGSPRVARGLLGVALAACLVAAIALRVHAQPESRASGLLQIRVDQMRDGARVEVAREPISSTVVLPDFYERRGFQPAWTEPAERADLLAALRGSAGDGLDPRDYHVAAIEALMR